MCVCLHVYMSYSVCLCISPLSLCFLHSQSHSITMHCAKSYSSTKSFSFTITSSSLSLHHCLLLSLFNMSVCFFLPQLLSLYLAPSEISPALSADCHSVWVCLLASLFVCKSKVRYVPEEVKWVLWPSVLITSWTELRACAGRGHSCHVKRAPTEDLVAS